MDSLKYRVLTILSDATKQLYRDPNNDVALRALKWPAMDATWTALCPPIYDELEELYEEPTNPTL